MQGRVLVLASLLGLCTCQKAPLSAPSPAVFASPPAILALPPDTPTATGQPVTSALQQVADQTDLAQAVAFQNWYGSKEQNQAFAAAPDAPPISSATNGSASAESGPIVVAGVSISDGYQLLAAKQGVDDQRFMSVKGLSSSYPALRRARYAAVQAAVAPSVKRYNIFWNQVEASGVVPSTSSSLTCPSGYIKVPSNEAQRVATGFQRYHCYNLPILADMDSYLALDASLGIESAAIMWGSPTQFQDPGCLGDPTLGKVPCAPTAASVYAWADYSALLASRWQGGPAGCFTHFIVWNEVDSSQWFDMSPAVNDTGRHIEGTDAAAPYVARYAAMLQGTHDAVAKNLDGRPSMVYVSIDRMWTASPWCPGPKWGPRCPLGAVNLLDLLWQQVGNKFDWSLAVHPYGIPTNSDWGLVQPYQAFTFADLPKVQAYQVAKLRALGVSNPLLAPQAVMAATEQGWTTGNAANSAAAAQYICVAHALANNNTLNIAFVTHNDFQDPYDPYPASHGLVPLASGPYLNATSGSDIPVTHQAYLATNPNTWGLSSSHFCCSAHQLGCAGPPAPSPPPGAPKAAPRASPSPPPSQPPPASAISVRPPHAPIASPVPGSPSALQTGASPSLSLLRPLLSPVMPQLPAHAQLSPPPTPAALIQPASSAAERAVRSSAAASPAPVLPGPVLQLPSSASAPPPAAGPVPPSGARQTPPPPAVLSTRPVVSFGLAVQPQGTFSSTTILAAIREAIQKYMSPVPVDVTATIAQQRRLLLQSTPSYSVDIQVMFPTAAQYSSTQTAASGFAQQLSSSSSTVLAAASSAATLTLASPPTVSQSTQSVSAPPPPAAGVQNPPPSSQPPPPGTTKVGATPASPSGALQQALPSWGLACLLTLVAVAMLV